MKSRSSIGIKAADFGILKIIQILQNKGLLKKIEFVLNVIKI